MTAEAYIAFTLVCIIAAFVSGWALGHREASDLWRARIDRMRRYYVGGMRDW